MLRIELKPHGIHVACIYPSDVDTPQLAGEEPYKPVELHRVAGTIKPIPPEQVADAILRGIARRRPVIYAEPPRPACSPAWPDPPRLHPVLHEPGDPPGPAPPPGVALTGCVDRPLPLAGCPPTVGRHPALRRTCSLNP